MSVAETKTLQQDIKEASEELGKIMNHVLPWRKTRAVGLLRALGTYRESVPIILHEDDAPEEARIYTRAWLTRDFSKREEDSTVTLLSDSVELDLSSPDKDIYRREDTQAIATYSKNSGLKLVEDLGTPQETTLNRIQELGGWVTGIAEATTHKRLIDTIPLLHPEQTR